MSSSRTGFAVPACLLLLIMLLASPAAAELTIEYDFILEWAGATSVSADGNWVAGNTVGPYEAFRWSESTGIELLGMASVPVLGVGGGTPDISADGTRISSTILSADSTYTTAGIWAEGAGWQHMAPPVPPDAGILDQGLVSAWGLSGDGSMVTGFYWRPCGVPCGGSAQAAAWNAGGCIELGGTVQGSSRVNAANYDGSVTVGWQEHASGAWQSTVWQGTAMTILNDGTGGFTGLECVNPDGTIIAGSTTNLDGAIWKRPAAYWTWNGNSWDEHIIGMLPFTNPIVGSAAINSMSADGSIMVGYHDYGFGNLTAVVWTQETGLLETEQWLAHHGVTFDETFDITSMSAISADGSVMLGVGNDTVEPYTVRTLRIQINSATSVAPALSQKLSLAAPYPNPFNPSTTLPLVLFAPARVELDVFDLRGRHIRTVFRGDLPSGRHEFPWDGRDTSGASLASGTYIARARGASGESSTQRLVLIK